MNEISCDISCEENLRLENIDEKTLNFLTELKNQARKNFVPVVRDRTAEKLAKICREKQPKRILEIGTAIGYSGIIMLKSCNATLVTIEKDKERAKNAYENFFKTDLLSRTTQIIEDAQIAIERLKGEDKKFDLIFLDGPKGQYKNYFPVLKILLAGGGTLFCDNVNLLGMTKEQGKIPHKHRSMVVHMREYIELLRIDTDLKTQFFDIDDGFSISTKVN